MPATWSACASCSQRAMSSIRSSPPTTRSRSRRCSHLRPPGPRYEFQRLHGMGEALYEAVRAEVPQLPPVRVYAPVGTHEDLLPYLVRRLLENGANSSFVHQFLNPDLPVEQVVRDPIATLNAEQTPPPARRSASRARCSAPSARTRYGEDFGDPAATRGARGAGARLRAPRSTRGGPIIDGGGRARRPRAGELPGRHAR